MIQQTEFITHVLDALVELLDIPESYYEKAKKRYESLGAWFHRPESSLRKLNPDVYPQGSFRYGTVIRPLFDSETYDLDLVCQISASKDATSQKMLKEAVGVEVVAYATAHAIKEPPQEKHRCWRIEYADDVSFHMDILPAIPDDLAFKTWLIQSGVDGKQAMEAIAITDRRHEYYSRIQANWPRSNPRGFAKWFENQMRSVAGPRMEALVEERVYASVDKVPAYQWKTPLQRSIQLLKRHRDVMFKHSPDLKPISMIVTTLAARSYRGEEHLPEAISSILERMPSWVKPKHPRVENPVNPAEDFADKWNENDQLEQNFWKWHTQAQADFRNLRGLRSTNQLQEFLERKFRIPLSLQRAKELLNQHLDDVGAEIVIPTVYISSGPKPWGSDG